MTSADRQGIYKAAIDAEDALSAELQRQFGADACDYRYYPNKYDAQTAAVAERRDAAVTNWLAAMNA